MTTISALASNGATPTVEATNPSATLGQNDFLLLLVAQLKYQDPMKPTDSSQFMGEMAQFSTVQGVTSLGTTMNAMSHSNDVSQGIAMIGKQITYAAPDGSPASGTVSSVSSAKGGVTLQVAAGNVALKDVLGVSSGD
ncbi:MAG TPA: flagellar hook capping FlgD N-terminal domain-containing protein [Gaiellales bacterium]|jgi:flagellar basal-body rod modification protein FlgD|nr:flagellar hook capping FlgD N-terminal domain-containing protein [Gaiellales bacterium]